MNLKHEFHGENDWKLLLFTCTNIPYKPYSSRDNFPITLDLRYQTHSMAFILLTSYTLTTSSGFSPESTTSPQSQEEEGYVEMLRG